MFNRTLIQLLRQKDSRSLAFTLLQCSRFSTCSNGLFVRNVVKYKEGDSTLQKAWTGEKTTLNTSRKVTSNNLSEKDFLVKVKHNPDSFGCESEDVFDEGDLAEEKFYTEKPLPSRKLTTKQYADHIKALIRKRKIKEAIDFVEIRMLQEDRVKPENYIYNLLLGACGRAGYTKKAFSLYNDMKKRGLNVTPGTYTALFNACANSPWKEDCLVRANHLRNIMIEKMYEPNNTNYNAMIKAFGRGGDLNAAFTLVDEMISKKIPVKSDTINFLLQACITDKEAGFRHALLVWHKLKARKIQPSVYTYNLMLRCVRDCGIGDVTVMKDVIEKLVGNKVDELLQIESPEVNASYIGQDTSSIIKKVDVNSEGEPSDNSGFKNNYYSGNVSHAQYVESSDIDNARTEHNEINTSELPVISSASKTILDTKLQDEEFSNSLHPNLMADIPHLGSIISLSKVTKPEDRLLLVGGLKGFLRNMQEHNCQPDIKTFTQLLDNIPSSPVLEKQLMDAMKKYRVKPDLDFYNMLIKKRSFRFDYEGGREVLRLIKKSGFKPNLITYGVLALGCQTKDEAAELIQEMQQKNYRLNIEILGAMLHQATYHMNFPYVIEIMELTLRENVMPNKRFMECLNEFKKKTKYISNDKRNKLYYSKKFKKEYNEFRLRYKTYLQEVQVENPEDVHPWQQFRQENENEKFKDKAVHFKPIHTSKFKVKTSFKQQENK